MVKKLYILFAIFGITLIGFSVSAFNTKINPLSAYKLRVATSVPSTWWTNGLVGYWNFDGPNTTTTSGALAGTRDVSNNGNWGTFYNGVKPVAGVVGQALSFDGVNDYVNAGNGASLNFGDKITIEAWFKPSVMRRHTIVNKGYAVAAANYLFYLESNNNLQLIVDNGPTAVSVSGSSLTTGQWYHLVVTYDSAGGTDNVKIYVNGAEDASATQTGDLANTQNLIIGLYGVYKTNGLIDEVRIYNRALSADEVMMHYQQTRRNLRIKP